MQKIKLKKILHEHHKQKNLQDRILGKKNDNRLHIKSATESEVKQEGQRSVLNRLRRNNVRTELNQYIHSDSKHIRLKPYFSFNKPMHWIGIVSDITLPLKNTKTEGAVLIDKVSTPDHEELYDYHLWLKITDIKFLQAAGKQTIAIGDYIEGLSEIVPYGDHKYGLSSTVILNCGIFQKINNDEQIVNNYDRGDDWVLQLENSSASERAKTAYEESDGSFDAIDEIAGHVTVKYQPSRYRKYQERLVNDEEIAAEAPLPLISQSRLEYKGEIKKVDVIRTIQNNEYEYKPVMTLTNVTNSHNRLVAASFNAPYTLALRQKGLVDVGQTIKFIATAGDKQLLDIKDYIIDNDLKFFDDIPETENDFIGYLLNKESKFADMRTKAGRKAIRGYSAWLKTNDIDQAELSKTLVQRWDSNSTYTPAGVARALHIREGWVDNLINQRMIVPRGDKTKSGELIIPGTEIDKIYQVMIANTDELAKEINDKYHLYRASDMAKIVGIPEAEVAKIIVQTPYRSFNKYYGEMVLDYVKERVEAREAKNKMDQQRRQQLLDKFISKTGIVTKRKIPKDNSLTEGNVPTKHTSISESNESDKSNTTQVKSNELLIPKPITQIEKVDKIDKANPIEAYEPHIIFKDSKTANSFKPEPTKINKDNKLNLSSQNSSKSSNIRVVFTSLTGSYYTDQFATKDEADKFFTTPLLPNELNRFINAFSVNDHELKKISVRAVLEWDVETPNSNRGELNGEPKS